MLLKSQPHRDYQSKQKKQDEWLQEVGEKNTHPSSLTPFYYTSNDRRETAGYTVDMYSRRCKKCGTEKLLSSEFFSPQVGCKDGFRAACRTCISVQQMAGRLANPEKWKAYGREKSRRDRAIARAEGRNPDKEYYEKNKATILVKQAKYNARNRDSYNAKLRRWRKTNPEKVQVWVRNRRARLKGLIGSHSLKDILGLLASQRSLCVYCRRDISLGYQVDHITPISAGGSNDKSNLQLLCKPCNLDKRAKNPIDYARERGLLL